MSQAWQSLRTRLAIGVFCTTITMLWVITLVISHYLRIDMEAAISSQQYSTVSLIAAEIDRSVNERLSMLQRAAKAAAHPGMPSPDQMQQQLERFVLLEEAFNWGVMIIDRQGIAVASIPSSLGRQGGDYLDVPYIQELLKTGQNVISDPMIGKRTGAPIFNIAVPIKSPSGEIIGGMIGITNLAKPNFCVLSPRLPAFTIVADHCYQNCCPLRIN